MRPTTPRNQWSDVDPVERFWSKVDRSAGPDGCWPWTGYRAQGYGIFGIGQRLVRAHRFAYELLVAPIPEGLHIDHLCRVPPCVNPRHMEPVTQRVNTLRGFGAPARHARQTECMRGHAFSHVYVRPNGRVDRRCRTCERKCRVERRGLVAA